MSTKDAKGVRLLESVKLAFQKQMKQVEKAVQAFEEHKKIEKGRIQNLNEQVKQAEISIQRADRRKEEADTIRENLNKFLTQKL